LFSAAPVIDNFALPVVQKISNHALIFENTKSQKTALNQHCLKYSFIFYKEAIQLNICRLRFVVSILWTLKL